MRSKPMIVAGVMSGTSADGIDVALVRIGEGASSAGRNNSGAGSDRIRLLGHAAFPYSRKVRDEVLMAMNAPVASVANLARLNALLGELYADAVLETQRAFRVKADLVGCHGQTLYHQGEALPFLGRRVATTWQTGEAAVIAARVGVPVVSDFRPADMAAGGKGAPLVPFLDYLWFRNRRVGRIVQNIGGIANLTAIPAGAGAQEIFAFDTGPGNMVIDAVVQELFGRRFDRGGKIAASGQLMDSAVANILKRKFFRAEPPKTAGREEFGREFVSAFLRACRGARNDDVVATATALTARSIADAVRRFVIGKPQATGVGHAIPQRRKDPNYRELILSGGGARNATLVSMIAEPLAPMGIVTRFSDEFGLPSEAKEAVAFAVLAYETWHRRPSNVPSATGTQKPAVLGKISYV
ncbi:MAG TPA: anhydro-N-acetylmuramic acid kinase [Candidatus Sulfotelmatobacter sp.]|nr:anhydro-N-acetylmuramic acid kinase [Candidatus Sulfotelmatobacter sp.]